jgi:type VI secretion system protein ImpL
VIWILLALLIGLAWVLCFILQWSYTYAIIASVVVLLAAGASFGLRRWRARRAAGGLERAIEEQGRQQMINARPDQHAEIQALQKQILDGIAALKASKLGGKRGGSSALYSLPWYAIIGPPGAGKTTAIKHSGLIFPYADTSVRGVGGTRNCDWWFTNEAILLDTAGRYATEHEDKQEWLAFLDMLRKYRKNKPLNGLLVAVSIPDIIDASERALDDMGKKLRERIDEVMTRLGMVLPVYFVITKCDLIHGFIEFFGNLRKSERAQAWGATLSLDEDKSNPRGLFEREFDILVREVHAMGMKRLAQERNHAARESIYQLPIELSGIRRNLGDLLSTVFAVNAFQGTPTFRGFYFTSGTQEGLPLNRVLQRMGQAMGIQPPQQAQQARVESKSYFLHDVFMKVVFPDALLAARSTSELRRQRVIRIAVSAVALLTALCLAIPAISSFFSNRGLLSETIAHSKAASAVQWDEKDAPIGPKLKKLTPLLKQLQTIDGYDDQGVPFGMRFLMYSGDRVHRPARMVYVKAMQEAFVHPTKRALELKLRSFKGEAYLREWLELKTYLMLSDVDNLDVEWATGRFTSIWASLQENTTALTTVDLTTAMRPHVKYYFGLIKPKDGKKARALARPPNAKIVKAARAVLQGVSMKKRYYAFFVDSLNHEKIDPSGDLVPRNLMYPPVTLKDVFASRKDVLDNLFTSRSYVQSGNKKWYGVTGPFTDWGHVKVLDNLKSAKQIITSGAWVVPPAPGEDISKIGEYVKQVAEDYEVEYIRSWREFLLDVQVQRPQNLCEAGKLFKLMLEAPRPLVTLLRTVAQHTQWKQSGPSGAPSGTASLVNRKLNQAVTKRTRGLRFKLDVNKIAGRVSRIPQTFKGTARFLTNPGDLPAYHERLSQLRNDILLVCTDDKNAPIGALSVKLRQAMKTCDAMFKDGDVLKKTTLLRLLQLPLNIGGKVPLSTSVRAQQALLGKK